MTHLLSVHSPTSVVLAYINSESDALYASCCRIREFHWACLSTTKERSRERWAGCYENSTITLDPSFFSGIVNPQQQHEAIVDILLHEYAHHIVHFNHGPACAPHGKEFRYVASYINGQLGRDAVDTYHSLAKTPEGKEAARAQRKALALLARTTSSNEHEASLAAAKFAEFTAQNNITLNHHAETLANGLPVMVKEHIWTMKSRSGWMTAILNAVTHVNGCTYTTIKKHSAYVQVHLYGRPRSISQSYDLIDYLTQAVDRVVAEERAYAKKEPSPRGRSYWMSFREGVALRVAKALQVDHNRRMREGVTAANGITHTPGLILRTALAEERAASLELCKELHPSIKPHRASYGPSSSAGLSEGYAAGGTISVAKQAGGTSTRSLAPAAAGEHPS